MNDRDFDDFAISYLASEPSARIKLEKVESSNISTRNKKKLEEW